MNNFVYGRDVVRYTSFLSSHFQEVSKLYRTLSATPRSEDDRGLLVLIHGNPNWIFSKIGCIKAHEHTAPFIFSELELTCSYPYSFEVVYREVVSLNMWLLSIDLRLMLWFGMGLVTKRK